MGCLLIKTQGDTWVLYERRAETWVGTPWLPGRPWPCPPARRTFWWWGRKPSSNYIILAGQAAQNNVHNTVYFNFKKHNLPVVSYPDWGHPNWPHRRRIQLFSLLPDSRTFLTLLDLGLSPTDTYLAILAFSHIDYKDLWCSTTVPCLS
jgi:hypothetical protein